MAKNAGAEVTDRNSRLLFYCYSKVLFNKKSPVPGIFGGRRPTRGEFEGAQPLQCPCGAAAKQRGIKRSGVSGIMNRVTSTKAELEGLRSEATKDDDPKVKLT